MSSNFIYPGFNKAYEDILSNVYLLGNRNISPRGMLTREIKNFSISIDGEGCNLFTNSVRSPNLKYLCGELIWYFSGSNSLEFISKYSKFWNKISDDGKTCNSAYGNLIFKMNDNPDLNTQWKWAFDSLVKDKDSRQAIIHFNRPLHQYAGVKDFPCTMYGVFRLDIYSKLLNFSIFMRSSDSILGTTYDIPFFMLLQQQMAMHLSIELNDKISCGEFYYHTNSQHIYERDFELVDSMIKNKFDKFSTPRICKNLINTDGSSTDEMVELSMYVSRGMELDYGKYESDELLKFLYMNGVIIE